MPRPDAALPPRLATPLSGRRQWALTLFFCLVLLIPGAAQYFGIEFHSSNFENRFKAELPAWPSTQREWARLPRNFERWYNDHFGLRGTMIKGYVLARYHVLGAIQVNTVLLGRDGWLYYTSMDPAIDPIASYRGTNLLGEDMLASIAANLNAWHDWCAARGIQFVFFVAPNKSAIFPEHLPASIKPVPRPNRLVQFHDYMRQHCRALIVDPTEKLLQRKDEPIYYRTDTHWTTLGALYATRSLMDAVRPKLPPRDDWFVLNPASFNKTVTTQGGGDLAHMLIMAEAMSDHVVHLNPLEDRNATAHAQGLSRPKAILHGDSFSVFLPPFLAQDFELIYPPINSRLDPVFIETEKPQLLILQLVERNLPVLPDLTRKINFIEGRPAPAYPPPRPANATN